jgi:hypothetical protein
MRATIRNEVKYESQLEAYITAEILQSSCRFNVPKKKKKERLDASRGVSKAS